jgi:hypothetical protein
MAEVIVAIGHFELSGKNDRMVTDKIRIEKKLTQQFL